MPNGILKLMKIDNYSHVLEGLNNAKERVGSMAALARLANVDPTNLTRWMTGARSPSLKVLSEILDVIGARIVFPEDVDADFSQDLAEKTEEIRRLRQELEKKAEEKFILEGRLRAYKEMMEEYRERLEAKENPAGAGKYE
jgi:transcriptional regulator with XRE-family HTH domain|nr:MAG TPA: Regulatory protein-modification, helix-turn-helix, transcriptional regulator, DNA [Caudoviricetes sp.]